MPWSEWKSLGGNIKLIGNNSMSSSSVGTYGYWCTEEFDHGIILIASNNLSATGVTCDIGTEIFRIKNNIQIVGYEYKGESVKRVSGNYIGTCILAVLKIY